MPQVSAAAAVDAAGLARYRACRTDVLIETQAGPDHFAAERGPFRHYERRLVVEPLDGGRFRVEQTTDYRWSIFLWHPILALPMRRRLRRLGGSVPWWAPPEPVDERAATRARAAVRALGDHRVSRHGNRPDHDLRGRGVRRQQTHPGHRAGTHPCRCHRDLCTACAGGSARAEAVNPGGVGAVVRLHCCLAHYRSTSGRSALPRPSPGHVQHQ